MGGAWCCRHQPDPIPEEETAAGVCSSVDTVVCMCICTDPYRPCDRLSWPSQSSPRRRLPGVAGRREVWIHTTTRGRPPPGRTCPPSTHTANEGGGASLGRGRGLIMRALAAVANTRDTSTAQQGWSWPTIMIRHGVQSVSIAIRRAGARLLGCILLYSHNGVHQCTAVSVLYRALSVINV